MIAWRLYYDGGGPFDSAQGGPADAPPLGVQAVVQADPAEGKHVLCRCDFYWFDAAEGRWFGGDLFGLFDFLMRRVGPVKFGRHVPHERWEAALLLAKTDPDFRAKGNWRVDAGPGKEAPRGRG